MTKTSSSSSTVMDTSSAKEKKIDKSEPGSKKGGPDALKMEAIKNALAQIKKQYGDGAIMEMGDTHGSQIEKFNSGSLSLDIALGGGIPLGRIIEIYGPESSGKTTIALHAIAEVQKKGGRAAFIDAEHALDPSYARKIGVDTDVLLISQPDDGEQALEITETLVRSGGIDLIVVDSVAALTPRAEIEGTMGDSHMGLQARLMSQALRKLTAIVSKTNCTVIFINQLRMKIGVMFGNPETTTGGNALKFYASLRLDVRRIDKIMEKLSTGEGAEQEIVGNKTRVKVVKNKVAPPFRQAEFDILYAKGISKEGDILDLGVKYGIIEKAGAYFRYGEETIGQGREQARLNLIENTKLSKQLEKEIREKAMAV
jgi:recombination protein RecA